jgi:hypothetical protein
LLEDDTHTAEQDYADEAGRLAASAVAEKEREEKGENEDEKEDAEDEDDQDEEVDVLEEMYDKEVEREK